MKLYLKECKKIASSILYYLFIAILVFSWSQNFRGVTQAEINRANGITPAAVGFERPLLSKPSKEGNYFGSKISEEPCCRNTKIIVMPHILLDIIRQLH